MTIVAIHSTRRAARTSLVANVHSRQAGIFAIVWRHTYNMARNGRANAPNRGCLRASESVTQMCP